METNGVTHRHGARFRRFPVNGMRCAIAAILLTVAPGAPAQRDARQSFALDVQGTPAPVAVGGGTRLVYELHLASFAVEPLRLSRIEVLDDASASVLAEFHGDALSARLGRPGLEKTGDKSVVAPGLHAVVYLDVPVTVRVGALRHRIEFESLPRGAPGRVEGGRTVPRLPAEAKLGPPLSGGPWVAIYGAEWERGHRRVLYAVDGQVRIPGRFAIDWIKLDADGRSFAGEGKRPADWHGYAADVLAVADATVAALRDDVPEPAVVASGRRVPIGDASGNYVALRLADGRHAFYEHLKPGSIKVGLGAHVRRGERIAALGYTGESTGPHLHFHLADAAMPLAAEGLPYAFEAWRPLGSYASIEAFGRGEHWVPAADDAATVVGEFPAPLAVIEFLESVPKAERSAIRR